MAKARATKKYRQAAKDATEGLIVREDLDVPFSAATITPRFFHATKRRRDKDNALASLKAAFDGMADAGLVSDDSELTYQPVEMHIDRDAPRVELEIQTQELN